MAYRKTGKFRARRTLAYVSSTLICRGCYLVRPADQIETVAGKPLCGECRRKIEAQATD